MSEIKKCRLDLDGHLTSLPFKGLRQSRRRDAEGSADAATLYTVVAGLSQIEVLSSF